MLTEILERSLNRNLPRSPRARELAAALSGRRLRVELRGTARHIEVESTGALLRLRSGALRDAANPPPGDAPSPQPAGPDAQVSGSPLALLALAGSDPEAVIRRGDVRISGDAEVARGFRELVLLLRPDLEEELSRFVGDAPAHHAMRLAARVLTFGRRAAATGVRNVAEFLGHETRDAVPKPEAESLFRDIERLREDVDRIEARIAQLGGSPGGPGERP